MVGESANLMLLDLHECIRVARENPDLIVGVKVRVGRGAGGSSGPARAIRRPSLGTLAVGTEGDATILGIEHGSFQFSDTQGVTIDGDKRFRLDGMVVGGRVWS